MNLTERTKKYIEAARRLFEDEITMIDDDAKISEVYLSTGADRGAWVQAWVWVDETEIKEPEEAARGLKRACATKGPLMEKERRKTQRHDFLCLVLEHRPDESSHPQATRVLKCMDFSKGGMLLEGQKRFDKFRVTLDVPHDGSKVDADVRVVRQDKDHFGVEFIDPSPELLEKLHWWP
jgi:hypothetical protein